MDKLARKPSSDPAQEKLRQNKALWNKDVSVFINDLINFKKTMNGAPSKFHPEKGNIKEPIPADPATIVGVLAGDFQEIAQKGNAIVSQQLEYSKTRRKSQPKAPVAPGAPPAGTAPAPETPGAPDLSKQLAAFETKYELVSEGSNAISRFFTKLLNPTFGFGEAARIRRVRMQLLKACANVYKNLDKFQVEIVKSSKGSIDSSNAMMQNIWRDWETVRIGLNTYKGMMPPQVPDSGGLIEPPEEVEKIKDKEMKEGPKAEEKLEKKMDQIDRAREEGKPEPGDAEYETPVGEESRGPDWEAGKEKLTDDLHEQQNVKLANWAKGDLLYALRNLPILHEYDIDIDLFDTLTEYVKRFSLRNRWAPLVIEAHKDALDELNVRLDTIERSFKDVIAVLVARKRSQEQMEKQKQKLEQHGLKEQQRLQKAKEKAQLAEQKAQLATELAAQKAQEKALQHQQKTLERAREKALLNVSPPVSAPAPLKTSLYDNCQLEVTAQKFLKKWVGKTRHQMSLFDDTSSQRLQIFEVSDEMRKTVDQIMDHLEKDIQIETLEPMVASVNRQLTSIRGLMRNLYSTHRPQKVGK